MSSVKKAKESGPTVYHDLGYADPDEMATKAKLVFRLQQHIKRDGLTITAAAKRLGIAQPDLSNLLKGRFRKYSVMSLARFLATFGDDVDLRFKAKGEKEPLAISLSAG